MSKKRKIKKREKKTWKKKPPPNSRRSVWGCTAWTSVLLTLWVPRVLRCPHTWSLSPQSNVFGCKNDPLALHWSVVIWIRSGVQNKVYFDITAVCLSADSSFNVKWSWRIIFEWTTAGIWYKKHTTRSTQLWLCHKILGKMWDFYSGQKRQKKVMKTHNRDHNLENLQFPSSLPEFIQSFYLNYYYLTNVSFT